MATVVCTVSDCINKGKECCTSGRIELDADGCCTCYQSYDTFMRHNREVDRQKCK